ncbi:MAG: hypothetical protein GXC94_04590 [Comamonadaceae bacterium]|nr:hypothetical protein [Comamonadaceae bacterium]
MAGFTPSRLRVAILLLCAAPLLAAAKPHATAHKPLNDAKPLRFAAPAAGPAQPGRSYDACIDQPSPDGAAIDCQALQRPVQTAKAKPRQH